MDFKLDYKNVLPFSDQLACFLREQIQTGAMKAGDKLPTMRDAAIQFHLSVSTVNAAYQALINESVLESRGRQGVFVSEDDREVPAPLSETESGVREKLLELLGPAVAYGKRRDVPLETIVQILTQKYQGSSESSKGV